MHELQNIHPFNLVENSLGQFELYFDANLAYELFEQVELDSTGAVWVDVIEYFLEMQIPHLRGQLAYDPTVEICTIIGDFEDIKLFVHEFRPLFFNANLLEEFLENMKEDWY